LLLRASRKDGTHRVSKLFSQYLNWIGVIHAAKREYRISNMEYRMMKGPRLPDGFSIRHSLLNIRYSFRKQGKFIFGEIPPGEDLAKKLPRFVLRVI